MRLLIGCLVFFGCLCFSIADISIYSHSFGGSFGDTLNGVGLDQTSGMYGGTTNAAWSSLNMSADGSKTGMISGGAVLQFTPQAGNVYRLDVTTDVTSGDSDWLAAGFATSDQVNASGFVFSNMRAWLLDRHWDQAENQAILGPSSGGLLDVGAASVGALNLSVILNASDADVSNWSAEWLINDSIVRSATPMGMTVNDITHIKLQGYGDASGTYKNFSLSVIPEPSTIAFMGFSGLIFFGLRRKLFR